MAGFRFRLYLENGNEIGAFVSAVRDWHVGDEFLDQDRARFRILEMVDGDDSEFTGTWTVAPLELPEPGNWL